MGKLNLITGSWEGKVGQLVGAKWKNKRTLRSYAKPSNPNTQLQQETRTVFKEMTQFCALFTDGIKQLTSLNTRGKTVRNAIIQTNKDQFNGTTFDPAALLVNKGGLLKITGATATYASGKTTFAFTPPNATNITDKAIAVAVVVDAESKVAGYASAPLKEGKVEVTAPVAAGKTGHCYLWIIDYRGTTRVGSNSEHLTVTGA